MDATSGARRIGVKFLDRDDFGRACEILTENAIRFSHRGFLTIVLSESDFVQLVGEPRRFLEKLRADHLIDEFPIIAGSKPPALLSRQQAKEALRKFAKPH